MPAGALAVVVVAQHQVGDFAQVVAVDLEGVGAAAREVLAAVLQRQLAASAQRAHQRAVDVGRGACQGLVGRGDHELVRARSKLAVPRVAREHAADLAVVLVLGKPAAAREQVLLARSRVGDHNLVQEPSRPHARVVVVHRQALQLAHAGRVEQEHVLLPTLKVVAQPRVQLELGRLARRSPLVFWFFFFRERGAEKRRGRGRKKTRRKKKRKGKQKAGKVFWLCYFSDVFSFLGVNKENHT